MCDKWQKFFKYYEPVKPFILGFFYFLYMEKVIFLYLDYAACNTGQSSNRFLLSGYLQVRAMG